MITFNFKDPNLFNRWRDLYDTMTDEEHMAFCEEAEKHFPSQQHFTLSNFDQLFSRVPEGKQATVLEIGGWKGELADYCLKKYSIQRWVNIELCKAAAAKTVHSDPRYVVHCPESFTWFKGAGCPQDVDICVASHVIEHFSDEHLKILLTQAIGGIPVVLFEAPLWDQGNDWYGDWSTHILKMGWNGVNRIMSDIGYHVRKVNSGCFEYALKK